VRYAIRRLRRKLPQATMLLGCWASGADKAAIGHLVKADVVVTGLREALEYTLRAARGAIDPSDAGETAELAKNAA
jgi:hypothetical protein